MASARSRPSAAANRTPRGPTPLPAYQHPTHPLNQQAQYALHDLPRNHKLTSLQSRLKIANSHLTQAAADINDRLQEKSAVVERRQKKREPLQNSQESNDDDNRGLDEMRQMTNVMTDRLEAKVRDVIDASAEVEGVERALEELDANVTAGRGALAPTQSTLGASQFRETRGRRSAVDEDSDEEAEGEDDSQPAVEPQSAVETLKRKIGEQRAAYQAESMSSRYASHNDYIGFRKIVHDAQYPGDTAPPMPHSSTWFPSSQDSPNASGSAGAPGTQPGAGDDDDDFQVASERISIKCPITLLPMRDPVSSTKCPHNFEREAILGMIDNSDLRMGGEGRIGGVKAMLCPVCEVMLAASDLQTDPVLIRKIKRAQAALRAENDNSDDEGNRDGGGHSIFGRSTTRPHEEVTSSPAPPRVARLKSERVSQAHMLRAGSRGVSVVMGTQLEDS